MIAGSLGFDYIELLAEREHNPMNPIWSEEGVERLKKVVDLANLSLPVFCNDYVIDNSGNKLVTPQVIALDNIFRKS